MRLVYLSPVPWKSFAQRPHKFVEWFHGRAGGEVLWIDPYPTRFPSLSDLRRLGTRTDQQQCTNPPWLKLIRPSALPIEPLPGSGLLNALVWRRLFHELDTFARQQPTMLVVGKPSVLALAVVKRIKRERSVYDAMDDFPAFYSGLSRLAMLRRERQLARSVRTVLVSSTVLKQRWSDVQTDVRLVHNGLDLNMLPPPKIRKGGDSGIRVLGYVGTIGAWFDWEWVIALAKARPTDVVRLIGPVFVPASAALPQNIEMLPPCNHHEALLAMQDFDVGLIPFRKNNLTASVDPIKYYEYRALGLPVISTDFGEMAFRSSEEGTFLSRGVQDVEGLVECALGYSADSESVRQFAICNSWDARFANSGLIF